MFSKQAQRWQLLNQKSIKIKIKIKNLNNLIKSSIDFGHKGNHRKKPE
tara:strand:+ start:476 stop:619 length:144 start_codon:yes stop_codon:yes gene_type:complete